VNPLELWYRPMIDDILTTTKNNMQHANESLERDLAIIRTGRSSPALVEHIQADYYGTLTPLNQLATISTPDARLIMIHPWDKGAVAAIEKAIYKSDLGLNPVNDGIVIRLALPPLSEERRKELVKLVKKRVEEGKVELRNIRRTMIEKLRELEKNKEISQDDRQRATDQLQKIIDGFTQEAGEIGTRKEKELMEV